MLLKCKTNITTSLYKAKFLQFYPLAKVKRSIDPITDNGHVKK